MSAQAQQLQSTMSFFKVDGRRPVRQVAARRFGAAGGAARPKVASVSTKAVSGAQRTSQPDIPSRSDTPSELLEDAIAESATVSHFSRF